MVWDSDGALDEDDEFCQSDSDLQNFSDGDDIM